MIASVTHSSTRADRYDVITAVWGGEVIELFLELCVSNQLSSGNLPALPSGSRYRILTSPEDAPMLAADPRLDPIRQVLPVDIVAVDMTDADRHVKAGQSWNVHKRMIACHRRAASDAAADSRALVFLAPDFVLGEGTLRGLVRLHTRGARAVLTANLRLCREEFLADYLVRGKDALPPRQLVGMALRYLHPWTRSLMADGETTSDTPTSVYWPVRAGADLDGLLVRSFYLHPMLVDPVRRDAMPGGPVDSHYVRDCCPDITQCQVVEDSDDLVVFELSPVGRVISNERPSRGMPPWRLAAVAANCDAHQLSHWHHPIRLHAGDLDERWNTADADSARLARRVDRYRPFGPLLIRTYALLKVWRQRRAATGRSYRRWRGVVRDIQQGLRRRIAEVGQVRKALRPPLTSKQLARPARLIAHRAAKSSKVSLKRIRRRVGLL